MSPIDTHPSSAHPSRLACLARAPPPAAHDPSHHLRPSCPPSSTAWVCPVSPRVGGGCRTCLAAVAVVVAWRLPRRLSRRLSHDLGCDSRPLSRHDLPTSWTEERNIEVYDATAATTCAAAAATGGGCRTITSLAAAAGGEWLLFRGDFIIISIWKRLRDQHFASTLTRRSLREQGLPVR